MRGSLLAVWLTVCLAGPVSAQEATPPAFAFDLQRHTLDGANKGMPLLEGWVRFGAEPQEVLASIPEDLADVDYAALHLSRAADSLLSFVRGVDGRGRLRYYVDRGNDEDFSNDEPLVFQRDENLAVARVTVASDAQHDPVRLVLYLRQEEKPEYHLDELWETTLSVDGEAVDVGIQRFPPDVPAVFFDVNATGRYERFFAVDREVLGLGGRFFKMEVDFEGAVVRLEETDTPPVDEGFAAPLAVLKRWKTDDIVQLGGAQEAVTVLSFWSPFCPGSRAEVASYNALKKAFGADESINFVAVSTDSTGLEDYLSKNEHTYAQVVNEALFERYGVTAPFVTFIIDQQGLIQKRFFGYSEAIRETLEKAGK